MPKNEKEKKQPQKTAGGAGEIALYEEDLYGKEGLKEETLEIFFWASNHGMKSLAR